MFAVIKTSTSYDDSEYSTDVVGDELLVFKTRGEAQKYIDEDPERVERRLNEITNRLEELEEKEDLTKEEEKEQFVLEDEKEEIEFNGEEYGCNIEYDIKEIKLM